MGKHIVIGGAGFIGSNLSRRLLESGHEVVIFDNLSRPKVEHNLDWLRRFGSYRFVRGDVSDRRDVEPLFQDEPDVSAVYLLAAQVAVTSSIEDPRSDFEINALGALNVLEAIRQITDPHAYPTLLYTSTNKVYGGLDKLTLVEGPSRYGYRDISGINERQPLDLHSPYGCSKGTADQYVRDYHRIYGLPTVVLRQSCIYGPRQFGNEDQGWVAHFVRAALFGRPLTIYGNGKQVRDLLYIDDLIDCFLRCVDRIDVAAGQVYNVGGGPQFQLSIRELVRFLEAYLDARVRCTYSDWRPGDQRCYFSDISKIGRDLGWEPKVDPLAGIRRLCTWMQAQRYLWEEVTEPIETAAVDVSAIPA